MVFSEETFPCELAVDRVCRRCANEKGRNRRSLAVNIKCRRALHLARRNQRRRDERAARRLRFAKFPIDASLVFPSFAASHATAYLLIGEKRVAMTMSTTMPAAISIRAWARLSNRSFIALATNGMALAIM